MEKKLWDLDFLCSFSEHMWGGENTKDKGVSALCFAEAWDEECLLWLHINCLLLPVRLISSVPQVTVLISCSLLGLANLFSFLNFDVLSALLGNFQILLSSTPRRWGESLALVEPVWTPLANPGTVHTSQDLIQQRDHCINLHIWGLMNFTFFCEG